MVSTTSMIIFGVIVLIATIVIWKWWNKGTTYKKPEIVADKSNDMLEEEKQPLIDSSDNSDTLATTPPVPATPMVFVINDNGNLDLTDMSGKVLNMGFGKNPKTYAILLDYAENDVDKSEHEDGSVTFVSKVGTTKHYDILDKTYIINYTRL
jgi:hypothetical protein